MKKTVATATVFFFSRCYHKINEAAYDVVTVYVKKSICLLIIFLFINHIFHLYFLERG